ncbi:diguanylate cyclase (GGDEF)-like protein [Amycolatopsis lexingtonensis]|uniref:Diguanylate cyclase (GGDEF)-like protein n=1 Tax=Amycolatopsis lexingtonensis TaxID=218822 RepID=A0ABR9IFK9_9PSEU|nr:GGDEF domain-containing protein [Amycolatopsis lexingtonensis]MBE1501966.1 diguanylate cyclase (GGDEF)-like protein [Amycolatopsis lexingtonensis]
MWKLATPVFGYVLIVDALALVVVTATAALVPITAQSMLWCGLILAGEVVHLEAAQRIERIRELAADGRPHMHLQSIWIFAGLLLLPPPLATLVIIVSYAHSWVRVYQRRGVIHRKVFSAATVILACFAAGAVLWASTGHVAPFVPYLDGFGGMTALLASGLVYFGLNYVLVILAILMSNPGKPPRQAFGNPSDVLIVLAAVGVGCGIALVMTVRPWLLPVLMVTPVALHIGLLLPQFQAAARTDSKTALLAPEFWVQLARNELARAAELSSTAGVLMIDIDHFKAIDDGNGHLAGDEVLRAVAAAIQGSVRGGDYVGRFGGDEFVVLLPGTTGAEIVAIADRIRTAIARIEVAVPVIRPGKPEVISGLTASIGAAVYPETATDYTILLQAADDAVFEAKAAGRDHVVLATPRAELTRPEIPDVL